MKIKNYEGPHDVIFSILPQLPPSQIQIFFSEILTGTSCKFIQFSELNFKNFVLRVGKVQLPDICSAKIFGDHPQSSQENARANFNSMNQSPS
jgi:hypothetical protein